MAAEDHQEHRGEPVMVSFGINRDGRLEMPGTIEWGDAVNWDMSVYLEQGGREIIRCGDAHRVRPDPGGSRPKWKRWFTT